MICFLLYVEMIIVAVIIYVRSFKSTHYLADLQFLDQAIIYSKSLKSTHLISHFQFFEPAIIYNMRSLESTTHGFANFQFFDPAIIPLALFCFIFFINVAKLCIHGKIEYTTLFISLFDLYLAVILSLLLSAQTKLKHLYLNDPEIKAKHLKLTPPEEQKWWHRLDWNRDPWIMVSDNGMQTTLRSAAARVVAPKITASSGGTQRPITNATNLHSLRSQYRCRSLDTDPRHGMNEAGRRVHGDGSLTHEVDGEKNDATPFDSLTIIASSTTTQVPADNMPTNALDKIHARLARSNDIRTQEDTGAIDPRVRPVPANPISSAEVENDKHDATPFELRSQRNFDESVWQDRGSGYYGRSPEDFVEAAGPNLRERGRGEPRVRQSTGAFSLEDGLAALERQGGNSRRYTGSDFDERGSAGPERGQRAPRWSTIANGSDSV
ncbi:hypothetical protein Vi05172_g1779 [Venturia inaequalis]|nr:hypothetical protein Vi05172_g1779 [Venturia inaequalis]